MSLATRLLLTLLPAVAAVTLGYGWWAVSSQRSAEMRELRREADAFTLAVGMALERSGSAGDEEEVREILEAITADGPLVGAVIYDSAGRPLVRSGEMADGPLLPADRLRSRRSDSVAPSTERSVNGRTVLSSVRPIAWSDGEAALEILSSEAGVRAAQSRTGEQFLVEALLVIAVVSAIILWLVRRLVRRPLQEFVEAVRHVGRGDLSWRIEEEPTERELRHLAREINRMAERLQETRYSLLAETEERIELEDRVQEAERVASVGTMAAGVAHQIASPLNVIAGRSSRLLRRGVEDPETERNLTVIRKESRRISKVVRTLLDFARRPEARLRPVDVSRVVRSVCAEHEGSMRDMDIELRQDLPDRARAKAEPDLLKEVVDVLLKNAVDALKEDGGERQLTVRVERAEHWVQVEVRDSGPGIPAELEERIFEPFVTTKPGGIGLGLTVARNVVDQLGGDLEAEPGRGGDAAGATFRFRLPSADDEGQRAEGRSR